MGLAAFLVMWRGPFEQTFVAASKGENCLVGTVVSEAKMLENVDGQTGRVIGMAYY